VIVILHFYKIQQHPTKIKTETFKNKMSHHNRDIAEKVSAEINKISKDVYNLTELLTDPAAREGLSPSLFNSMLKNVTILEKKS